MLTGNENLTIVLPKSVTMIYPIAGARLLYAGTKEQLTSLYKSSYTASGFTTLYHSRAEWFNMNKIIYNYTKVVSWGIRTLYLRCTRWLYSLTAHLYFLSLTYAWVALTFYPCCTIHFGFSSTENYISSLYTDGVLAPDNTTFKEDDYEGLKKKLMAVILAISMVTTLCGYDSICRV